jgi:hypothetical protein
MADEVQTSFIIQSADVIQVKGKQTNCQTVSCLIIFVEH